MTPVVLHRKSVRVLQALVFTVLPLAACATPGDEHSRQDASALVESAGTGVASVIASALYAPVKVAYATTGSIVGGGAYLFSGGNGEVANAVIGPAVGGHYLVTPERLRNPETLQFVGTGYEVVRRPAEPTLQDALPAVAAVPPGFCEGLGTFPTIHFASGRTALGPADKANLEQAASVLRACPMATVEIRAFSDSLGARDTNLELSRLRAQAVRTYLVEGGIAENRLRVLAFGEDNPVAVNATETGRAANRRVEVTLR